MKRSCVQPHSSKAGLVRAASGCGRTETSSPKLFLTRFPPGPSPTFPSFPQFRCAVARASKPLMV